MGRFVARYLLAVLVVVAVLVIHHRWSARPVAIETFEYVFH